MATYTIAHLDNIEQVLFGQQKQGSVINAAVVKIVARELSSVIGFADSTSLDAVHDAIMEYLKHATGGSSGFNDDALMLIVGEESLANLKSGQPVTIYTDMPSETSTKHIYRINVFGQNADVDNTGDIGRTPAESSAVVPKTQNFGGVNPNADFQTQAQQLHDAIMPLVPDAVKMEVKDEYAQCLVCAEQYFKYR